MSNLLSSENKALLCCPKCKQKLTDKTDHWECLNTGCLSTYPVVDGIPILINESNSIFSLSDFTAKKDTYFNSSNIRLKQMVLKLTPNLSINLKGAKNYSRFSKLLEAVPYPKVLIVGGGIVGEGLEGILTKGTINFIESDVYFGPRTALVCDSHDIPFADDTFDGIIVQAVLEHVLDPYRCVEEFYRVLKPHGLIYAETPFMQQVHARQYDFTRFTHLGHRRLFRKFSEVDSGPVVGPGTALAWSYRYFLLSFAPKPNTVRRLIILFTSFTGFFLKYFDYFLINRPGAFDAASGYYFMGRKSENILSDRDLVTQYRGAM